MSTALHRPLWRTITISRRAGLPSSRWACPRVPYSTEAGNTVNEADLRAKMLSRPPKVIPDYLVPMPSHLLTTTINDLLLLPPTSSSPSQTPASPISNPAISRPPQTLPQGHHLVYFPIQSPPSHLLSDGADPDHSPGGPFTRRMWAGGEVSFHPGWEEELRLDGREWVCEESIDDVRLKGDDGPDEGKKVFVDVLRKYGVGHETGPQRRKGWSIRERRTLVFMSAGAGVGKKQRSSSRITRYPHEPTASITATPSPIHLFHFSALTFNAHAIHLNPLFAQSTDGHKDLLVHGPLSLALMLRVLSDALSSSSSPSSSSPAATSAAGTSSTPGIAKITYRNYAPLYVDETLRVCARKIHDPLPDKEGRWDVWVEGPEGGLAVKGSVEVT